MKEKKLKFRSQERQLLIQKQSRDHMKAGVGVSAFKINTRWNNEVGEFQRVAAPVKKPRHAYSVTQQLPKSKEYQVSGKS